ncbi:hypothetical protein Ancab_029221 [Ancistrocladus abbreviatus]
MGAHAAAPPLPLRVSSLSPTATFLFSLLVFLLLSLSPIVVVCSNEAEEAKALAKFRASLNHEKAIANWNPSASKPCSGSGLGGYSNSPSNSDSSNWLGVICFNDTIWGLQLENMDLSGNIDVDALSQLDQLRTLSFKNNKFYGPIPDFRKLPKLRSLYLSNNRFSGEILDDGFLGMNALRRLHLANNSFSGNIPTSLITLPRLVELRIEGNNFQGTIPNFEPIDPIVVNAAHNHLEGPIPPSLRNLTANNFAGNKALCGPPLDTCTNNTTTNPITNGNKAASKANDTTIIVLSVLLALAILILILAAALFYNRRRQKEKLGRNMSSSRQQKPASDDGTGATYTPPEEYCPETKKAERGKLAFVGEDREKFDLSELLRASAEVLGSGNFGSSYKAVMLDGQAIVVKRFRQMNKVGRQDFYEHMRRMGKLGHPNVLPVVACYYRKEEKLLICDFVDNGSLASHLHGNRNITNSSGLDWQTRLRIIKGITRGLAYLYSEFPSLTTPHSHLKSSNVLLNSSFEPLLTDYALAPLINPEQAQKLMVAYKSPEFLNQGQITKKTDVWSLGILILEMLTGKFPTNYLAVGNVGASLAGWVDAIASELEGSADHLFDKEMSGTQNAEGEMRKLLKIGLSCCEEDVEKRWGIKETMEMIEEVKERDN